MRRKESAKIKFLGPDNMSIEKFVFISHICIPGESRQRLLSISLNLIFLILVAIGNLPPQLLKME